MSITERRVFFTDAVSQDGIDYGTGYYLSITMSGGGTDLFGPYNYEEDATSNNNITLY